MADHFLASVDVPRPENRLALATLTGAAEMATLMQRRIGGGGGEGKGVIGDTALPEGREREKGRKSLKNWQR